MQVISLLRSVSVKAERATGSKMEVPRLSTLTPPRLSESDVYDGAEENVVADNIDSASLAVLDSTRKQGGRNQLAGCLRDHHQGQMAAN